MAALAAGVASSMAQSNVYSLNVVGYVNYPLHDVGNFYLISNPLDNTTNDLNTIVPAPPDGSTVQLWSTALQDLSPTTPTYVSSSHTWVPDVAIATGQGFFVIPNASFTNTFVGTVRQYAITNSLVGNGNFECIGSTAPLGGSLTNVPNVLGQYPAHDGDTLQLWDEPIQDLNPTTPTYVSSTGKWAPDYSFNVGDGFFIVRNGAAVTWVNQFTVP